MNYFSFLYFGPCSFEVLVSNTSIFIKSLPWYHKNHESETAYYTLTLLTRVNFCLQVHRFCSNFQCFYLFIYLIMYERIKISSWYYLINSKIESQLRSKYIYKLPMLSGFAWEIGRKTWRKENKLLIWTEIFSETSWVLGLGYEKEMSKTTGLSFLEVTDPQYIVAWRVIEEADASATKFEDAILTLEQEFGSLM